MTELIVAEVPKGANGGREKLRRVVPHGFWWCARYPRVGCLQLASDPYQRHNTRRTSEPEWFEHLDTINRWARPSTTCTIWNTATLTSVARNLKEVIHGGEKAGKPYRLWFQDLVNEENARATR